MDWAQKKAAELVSQFQPMFRDDAGGMAAGLINAIAGELRATAAEVHGDAMNIVNQAATELSMQRRR